MTTLLKAAQQALEALVSQFDGRADAIDILSAALAQQAEPVAYTTGHCENHKQKGGCQLHNLQCGWPDCDRKPSAALAQQAEPVGTAGLFRLLSDDEIQAEWSQTPQNEMAEGLWFGRRIEGLVRSIALAQEKAESVAFDWPRKACPCRDVQHGECTTLGCKWERDPSLVPQSLRRASRPIDEGELWSWVRSVMSQGADIRFDYEQGVHKGYEAYSARLDAAAAERAEELAARLKTPNVT